MKCYGGYLMKHLLQPLRRICMHTCCTYTILSLFLFLIGSSFPQFGNMIEVSDLLTIFFFSLLLSCANLILRYERMHIFLRVLLHYLVSAATFFVIFLLIAKKASGTTAIFSDMILFTFLYAIVIGVYLYLYFSLRAGAPKKDADSSRQEKLYK